MNPEVSPHFSPEQESLHSEVKEQRQNSPESPDEQLGERQRQETIAALRTEIANTAVTAEKPTKPTDTTASSRPSYADKELQKLTSRRALNHIQHKLSPPQRTMSKVVHQPAIKVLSEVGERTVTRPSGMLGGGLCAFLGSLTYLYFAGHIGWEYNYFLFALFFIGGFMIGLIAEGVFWLASKHRD